MSMTHEQLAEFDRQQAERENLIEGDPVVVVDELLELRALKARIEADIYWNDKMLETLQADYRAALNTGREMMANQISEHRGRLEVENKVLRKLLLG